MGARPRGKPLGAPQGTLDCFLEALRRHALHYTDWPVAGMSALDAGVVLLLVLIAAGGYRQGLLRGLVRLAALLAIAALAALLALGLAPGDSIRGVLLRAGLLFGGVVLIIATVAWLLERSVPASFQRTLLNKCLGVVPALAVGLVVCAMLLGLAQRIAFGDELQRYLAGGIVTGPLARPLQWLERSATVGRPF